MFNFVLCFKTFRNMFSNVLKSDQTKERLFKTAINLFIKKGFDKTTMREIAKAADMAVAATYYYFDNKEALVFEYYKKSQEEHAEALREFLQKEFNFSKRLHRTVTSKIELALPYKNMARALYRVAANPESPISPFSPESKDLRIQALKIFFDVVEGSQAKFNPEIKKILPECLWLYQMGIILFWIYDDSKDSQNTFKFIDKTVPLIESMNQMIQSPLAVPFRKKIIVLLKSFVPDLGQSHILSKKSL